jgi:hypothetical protein
MVLIFSVFSIRYCPHFVRPSVIATSLQGIDQFCSFMAQSMAYESGISLKEGISFGTGPGTRGTPSSNRFVFLEVKS